MEGNGECVRPTKVTLIETRCVKVEAKDFKSTVQSLTGVNSSVAWIGNTSYDTFLQKERKRSSPPPLQQPQPQLQQQRQQQSRVVATSRAGDGGGVCLGGNANVGYNFDNNGGGGVSNVDLDEMLQGLPLMEEYHLQNWSWDNVKE